MPAGEPIRERPQMNIYTVLAAITVVVQIIGLAIIWIRANEVGGLF
jgi:hypothetical protein